jgi:hypothetical protein
MRLTAPALGLALAATAAVIVVFFGVGRGGQDDASAAAALRDAAAVAAAQPAPAVLRPGEYLYVKSVDEYLATGVFPDDASFSVLVPHVREFWRGPDGGVLRETSGEPRFLSQHDRETWIALGRPPLPGTEPGEGDVPIPPSKPLDLPADPDALYARLRHDAAGKGSGLYAQMFEDVAAALRETATTPALRAALYEVAARIPDVELVGEVTDRTGRRGIAVARDDEVRRIRYTFVFDPVTSVLLAEEQSVLDGNWFGYPAGTVIGHSTYLVTTVVGGLGERPPTGQEE